MCKLGTYRSKNVYSYDSRMTAINASVDNDIFSVYWNTDSWGKMFWRGEEIAHVHSDSQGLHVIDFDEEVWSPKKKEAPVSLLPHFPGRRFIPCAAGRPITRVSTAADLL